MFWNYTSAKKRDFTKQTAYMMSMRYYGRQVEAKEIPIFEKVATKKDSLFVLARSYIRQIPAHMIILHPRTIYA